jgi:hypothetical protein
VKRILFASLLLAAPALAQQPYGYPPPTPVRPGYIVPRQQVQPYGRNQPAGDVQRLADELAHATSMTHDLAMDEILRSGDRWGRHDDDDRDALKALRKLERRAARYEASADELGGLAPQTREDFEKLLRAYDDAVEELGEARHQFGTRQSFARVQQLMEQLAPYYGVRLRR